MRPIATALYVRWYNIPMERYILDTNLFFNMQADMGLGNCTEDIIISMTGAMQKAKNKGIAEFYMPPPIVAEIESFFDNPSQTFLKEFFALIIVKSPAMTELTISAALIGEIIVEARMRAFRGMKIGEEEISNAASQFKGKEVLGKKEFQMAIVQTLTKYRDRYRNATRTGFIDSVADYEMIMLAKELNATLISTDEGVISWSRRFGVKEMHSSVFGKMLLNYA